MNWMYCCGLVSLCGLDCLIAEGRPCLGLRISGMAHGGLTAQQALHYWHIQLSARSQILEDVSCLENEIGMVVGTNLLALTMFPMLFLSRFIRARSTTTVLVIMAHRLPKNLNVLGMI